MRNHKGVLSSQVVLLFDNQVFSPQTVPLCSKLVALYNIQHTVYMLIGGCSVHVEERSPESVPGSGRGEGRVGERRDTVQKSCLCGPTRTGPR